MADPAKPDGAAQASSSAAAEAVKHVNEKPARPPNPVFRMMGEHSAFIRRDYL